MVDYTQDYLLNKQIKIFQPTNGYRASTDAVIVSSLVEQLAPSDRVLDVGSGTGAISLCLASRFADKMPQIVGLELQEDLTDLSNLSAQANGFSDFLHYYHCDIRQKIDFIKPGTFQHVITNPPYTDHDMPSPNPSKAKAHNHSNFDLHGWILFCLKMLAPQGWFYMINRAEAVDDILFTLHGKAGALKLIPLFTKSQDRAKRILVMAKKSSRTPAQILPPFLVHTSDGYTNKAHLILREGRSFWDNQAPK